MRQPEDALPEKTTISRGGRGTLSVPGLLGRKTGMSAISSTLPAPQTSRNDQPDDDYLLLNEAISQLRANSNDDSIRLQAIRAYLSHHLVLPAKELMQDWPVETLQAQELQALRQIITKLSGSPIPWERFEAQFRTNLAALSRRGIEIEEVRRQWDTKKHSYQVFKDRSGAFQVRRQRADEGWDWVPTLGRNQADDLARPLPPDINSKMPGPYLFDGLGWGRFFERVYAATLDTFLGYSCALYVLEPSTEWLAVLLHIHDWAKPLSDPRVRLHFGPECIHQLRREWETDFDLPWPHHAFSVGADSGGPSAAVRTVQEAGTQREQIIRDSLKDLERRYAGRDIRYWADRFAEATTGKGRSLRILSAVSTHTSFLQHSMRDARRALEALGHEVRVLTEDRPFTIIGPLTYHAAIRDFDPDVFLVFDHLRPECAAIIPQNLPILTWDQDQLPQVFTPQNLARISRHDFIAGCSKFHCLMLGCNPRQLLNARVPTCPEQFSGVDLSAEEIEKYVCDVSYVSHASQTPREFHEEERATYSDPAVPLFLDVMYELLPEQLARYRVVDGGVMSMVFDEACRRRGITDVREDIRARLCRWYLWRLGDRMFRHEALEWVASWAKRTGRSFRIYGNGWEKHPTLAEFAAGPAKNGRDLLCVYRASRISLQLMPAGFVHQRSLDGLSAGGFFLGRLTPDDLRGRTLRSLVATIDTLRIATTKELLGHADQNLQDLLRAYVGERLNRMDHFREDLLTHIRVNAELTYPDEVFPDFTNILFDSADQWAQRAELFLANEESRKAIAAQMRAVVIEHYSYQSTMRRFIQGMTDYLVQAAGGNQKGSPAV